MFPSCLPYLSLFEHCGFSKSSLITEPSTGAHQEGLNVSVRMYICITSGGTLKWDLKKKSNTLCIVTVYVWYRQLPLLQSQGENSSVEQGTELGNKGSKGNLKYFSAHLWLWIFCARDLGHFILYEIIYVVLVENYWSQLSLI